MFRPFQSPTFETPSAAAEASRPSRLCACSMPKQRVRGVQGVGLVSVVLMISKLDLHGPATFPLSSREELAVFSYVGLALENVSVAGGRFQRSYAPSQKRARSSPLPENGVSYVPYLRKLFAAAVSSG